ncbi:MAG: LysE family translocator [Comamonas sp.]|nr:LysE family translocator [Comamonas sp.]
MPTADVLLSFFGISVLLGLTPGPDNLFVLMQSAQHGWRVGLAVVLGLCLGIVGHTCAVALGLAALLAANPLAFGVMKLCGAAYLCYLAWGAWRAPVSSLAADLSTSSARLAWPRMVARGWLMNSSNPKVLVFFLALLPQFADPMRGSIAAQLVVLGLVFMLASWLVFGSIALFSGWFGTVLLRSARAQRGLNRAAAAVFVALALRLLWG